jgi:cytochrome c oxidase assembly factor CtaG
LWIFLFAPLFLVLAAAVIVASERVARRRAGSDAAK